MEIFTHINKNAISIALATGVGIIALSIYLFSRPADDATVTKIELSPIEGRVGRELLLTLSTMKNTKLDVSVFEDPLYQSLHDFGVEIAPQPVGRRNPFGFFTESKESSSGSSASSKKTTGGTAKTPPPEAEEETDNGFSF